MITLYGFGRIFPEGIGETKDLRAQWALEETGLPYRVHALDHTAGELDSDAYKRISPFRQAPVIDDDGFVVAESAAVVLYVAEKAGKLIPSDVQGRTRVVQWCFAAVGTVEPTLVSIDIIGIFGNGKDHELEAEVRKLARRWLGRRTPVGRPRVDRLRGLHRGRHHDGRRPARHPQDRPDGALPEVEGLLRALCGPTGLAAHPRSLRRATRRQRRRHSLEQPHAAGHALAGHGRLPGAGLVPARSSSRRNDTTTSPRRSGCSNGSP
jgi:hypothetical protein